MGGVEAAIGGVVVDPYADKDASSEKAAEKAAAASSEPTRESFYAPLTVVCDGYFSTFRKKLRRQGRAAPRPSSA